MKKENFKASVTTAYGAKLPKALNISGEFDAYETREEVEKDYAKPGEFDKFVIESANAAAKASAIATARTAALDEAGIKAPKLGEDREATIRHFVRGLVATGKSEDEARKIAEQLV